MAESIQYNMIQYNTMANDMSLIPEKLQFDDRRWILDIHDNIILKFYQDQDS